MTMHEITYKELISAERIAARVKELGAQIKEDFGPGPIIVIGVLKGAFMFLSDLVRAIDLPMRVEFIGVASYAGTESTGHVRLTHDLAFDINQQKVLLVEDIIDSGRTIDYLMDLLDVRRPKKLAVAAFLSKPEMHSMNHRLDYVGFEISKEFVIGYGLDLDQRYRNLPYVAQVQT